MRAKNKSSDCPTCGQRMILIKDVPLRIYKCQECGVPVAETEEAKEWGRSPAVA